MKSKFGRFVLATAAFYVGFKVVAFIRNGGLKKYIQIEIIVNGPESEEPAEVKEELTEA